MAIIRPSLFPCSCNPYKVEFSSRWLCMYVTAHMNESVCSCFQSFIIELMDNSVGSRKKNRNIFNLICACLQSFIIELLDNSVGSRQIRKHLRHSANKYTRSDSGTAMNRRLALSDAVLITQKCRATFLKISSK